MATLTKKLILSSSISSALGVTSMVVYDKFMPKNIFDSLNRVGHDALTSDTDFEAVFYDQKEKLGKISQEIIGRTLTLEKDRKAEVKAWCKDVKAAKDGFEVSKSNSYYIDLCTSEGIKSVKGFLTKTHSSAQWIEDNTRTQDQEFRGVFSYFRSSDSFVQWMKSKGQEISQDSAPSTHFGKLKEVCKVGLKKNWRDISESERENYFFYCKKLDKNIEKVITEKNPDLEKKKDNEFTGVYESWKGSMSLNEIIKKYNKSKTIPTMDNSYKEWCKQILPEKLGKSDDVYPEIYSFAKSVCFKSR